MRISNILLLIFFSTISLWGQYSIEGRITNANGEPLIQASVFLISTYHASVTDEKGFFRIEEVPAGEYSLKVSYVGYRSYTEDIYIEENLKMDIDLGENILAIGLIEINASRVKDHTGFTYTNLNQEAIEKENLGQDVPFLLRWTPSAVVTSNAGNGVGYTGIRIRGSDGTRINVSINDVPLNDSESHDVFWVDLPDFISSTDNVQIQRGVGTSTSGPGAFGGSISMNTHRMYQNPYAHVSTSYGSFNSKKLSVNIGTGLLNGAYSIDARYSIIKSDGYIDRANSDLKSWYFSAGKIGKKSNFRFLAFSGNERTYQSWNGTPEARVNNDVAGLQAHYDRNAWGYTQSDSINLFSSGRTYNFYEYENQVDDYQQDHYQLHYSVAPSSNLKLKSSAFYTRGFGFFEEFKANEGYENYSLPEVFDTLGELISSGDLVRRRWLDNDFYGLLLNGEYNLNSNLGIQFGGGISEYKGNHYGHVVSAQGIENVNLVQRYYQGTGDKRDANLFLKIDYRINKLDLFGEVQGRKVDYKIAGTDNDLTALDVTVDHGFFNPKIGAVYNLGLEHNVYASFAVGHKEPTRGDYVDNLDRNPEPEKLQDFEIGYRWKKNNFSLEWNNYLMMYTNQLVLTGMLDISGAFVRTNVGKSSRMGTELSISTQLHENLFWNANIALSRNRVEAFLEDLGGLEIEHENTNISFSPSIVAASAFLYKPKDEIDIELSTKFVGKQYLDNTSNDGRKLPAYTFSNLRIGYNWDPSFVGRIKFNAMIYNLFDALYSSNGYTYSYFNGDIVTENFLYPQAGMHFMLGVKLEF